MLESLVISNFQAHEKLVVIFDKSITTVIGPSDVGKSSILRAIRWVCLNQPQGDGFIRQGSKGTQVNLCVDGHEIIRKRMTNGENTYHLDGVEYKAFGTGVPDAIQKVLGVSGVNFAGQHAEHFWFSLTAGEVSRQLNSVVDLSIIDDTLEKIGKRVRGHQEELRIGKERLQKAKAQKAELDWVVGCDVALKSVEDLGSTAKVIGERCKGLRAIIDEIKRTRQKQTEANRLRAAIAEVGKAGAAAIKLQDRSHALQVLIGSVSTMQSIVNLGKHDISALDAAAQLAPHIENKVTKLRYCIEQIKNWGVKAKNPPSMDALDAAVVRLNKVHKDRKELCSQITALYDCEVKVADCNKLYEKEEKALHDAMDGVCPVCGSEV